MGLVRTFFGFSEGHTTPQAVAQGRRRPLKRFRIVKRRRLMGDEKSSSMAMTPRDRDRELLIPVGDSPDGDAAAAASSKPSSSASSSHHAGREVIDRSLAPPN